MRLIKAIATAASMLAISVTASYGQCLSKTLTIGYFDADRFVAVDRVLSVSQEHGAAMVKQDILAGRAVVIQPGTKAHKAQEVSKFASIFEINGSLIVAITSHFDCK